MNIPFTSIQPVILAGGSGARLWPLSRDLYPKQVLSLSGKCSLLQSTLARLAAISAKGFLTGDPLIVCNEDHRFLIAEQVRECGSKAEIIIEPLSKNTAPALTVAALHAVRTGDDPILVVAPADHVIRDGGAFQASLRSGLAAASAGDMVVFGIVPDRPETGYGYIRTDSLERHGLRSLAAFIEKPDRATAESYVVSDQYYWNSGMFMLRATVWLEAIRLFQPEILSSCESAYRSGRSDMDFFRVDRAAFALSPSDSIDYAVMEKLPLASKPGIHAVVVPLNAGWTDVGAWDAVWGLLDRDGDGNAVCGDVLLQDTTNTLVHAGCRLVACIGVNDIILVETPDAVLVAGKDSVQDVKQIVARLKRLGRSEHALHRKVYRPWGWYDSVDFGERFQVKRIMVKPGARLSLQMHHHRAEHWVVVRGTARITRDTETFLLSENESTYIPIGTLHRLDNPGKVPLEMIEIQSGSYLGEDDIVRFDDIYGRDALSGDETASSGDRTPGSGEGNAEGYDRTISCGTGAC